MKKRFILGIFAILFAMIFSCDCTNSAESKPQNDNNIKISNKLFYISVPKEAKGEYKVKRINNGIFIFDKPSRKAGFGGFAFGISAYKNPSEYAMNPGTQKLGELTDKKGNIYDITLIRPTDVQYDYVNGKSKSYDLLYNHGDNVEIIGKRDNKYYKNQGTKGENLYKSILQKHINAVEQKWDSIKLEQENMSYMYNVLAHSNKNVLENIGYAYYDVNGDGIDELFIGEISNEDWKGIVYDIYTMVNRKPVHVVSGGSRNRYFVCDDVFLCNEYSSGAKESGILVYILVENSNELFPQVGFKYDGYANQKTPWFISYNFKKDEWENVSEQTYNERKKVFNRYERFDYIPLSTLVNE